VLQPLKAIRIEPSAQNGENRFIIGSGRMHVFLQKIPGAGFMSPAAFVCGICSRIVLIVWGEIGGGVCLPRPELKQNL
jgi:hypothetical protein